MFVSPVFVVVTPSLVQSSLERNIVTITKIVMTVIAVASAGVVVNIYDKKMYPEYEYSNNA